MQTKAVAFGENEMGRKFGYYIALGLLTGVLLGRGVGAASGNIILGIALGALAGLFVGWFVAAAVLQNRDDKKKDQ